MSDMIHVTKNMLSSSLETKQDTLSDDQTTGNIKTINGSSILGTGNLTVSGLPTIASGDEGKVLKVVNQVAAWEKDSGGTPNDYLKSIDNTTTSNEIKITPVKNGTVKSDVVISAAALGAQPTLSDDQTTGNIKTINGSSILGTGNLTVSGLPTITSGDEGKVLKVSGDEAAWSDEFALKTNIVFGTDEGGTYQTIVDPTTISIGKNVKKITPTTGDGVKNPVGAVAIGSTSKVSNYQKTNASTGAVTIYTGGVAIGNNAIASGNSVAIGIEANNGDTGFYSIAIGSTAKNLDSNNNSVSQSITIGGNARTYSAGGITIGTSAVAYSIAVAIGNQAKAGSNSISIGANAQTYTTNNNGRYAIAIGNSAGSPGVNYAISIGANAKANHENSVAIGYQAVSQEATSLNFSANYDKVYFNSKTGSTAVSFAEAVAACPNEKIVNGLYEITADGTVKKPDAGAYTATQVSLATGVSIETASPTFNPHYDATLGKWVLADSGAWTFTFPNTGGSSSPMSGADSGKVYTNTPITTTGDYAFVTLTDSTPTVEESFGTFHIVVSSSQVTTGQVVSSFATVGTQTPTITDGEANLSTLFTTSNTANDAANINYTATGETATTVKAKIVSLSSQINNKRDKTDNIAHADGFIFTATAPSGFVIPEGSQPTGDWSSGSLYWTLTKNGEECIFNTYDSEAGQTTRTFYHYDYISGDTYYFNATGEWGAKSGEVFITKSRIGQYARALDNNTATHTTDTHWTHGTLPDGFTDENSSGKKTQPSYEFESWRWVLYSSSFGHECVFYDRSSSESATSLTFDYTDPSGSFEFSASKDVPYTTSGEDYVTKTYVDSKSGSLDTMNVVFGTDNTGVSHQTVADTLTVSIGKYMPTISESTEETGLKLPTNAVTVGSGSKVGNYIRVNSKGDTETYTGSVAVGNNAYAVGSSIAIGQGANTGDSAYYSIAVGTQSKVNSHYMSVAIGPSASIIGDGGVSLGYGAQAAGNSVSIGNGSKATVSGSIAIGGGTTAAQGNNSIVIGCNSGTSSTGARIVCLGAGAATNITANDVIAIGYQAKPTHETSTSIGYQAISQEAGSLNFSANYDKVYFNSKTGSTAISFAEAVKGVNGYGLASDSSSTLQNKTINYLSMSTNQTLVFPSAVSGLSRDFLLYLDYNGGTVTFPTVTTYGDTPSFTSGKDYLLTFTEIRPDVYFVKSIQLN